MNEPKVITIHTVTYAPWEEGEDEPRKIGEDEREHDTADWAEDGEYTSAMDEAVAILTGDAGGNRFYAVDPSGSPLTRANALRTWWSAEPYLHPYNGTREEETAHLSGWTEDEAWEIHKRVAAILSERHGRRIPVDA